MAKIMKLPKTGRVMNIRLYASFEDERTQAIAILKNKKRIDLKCVRAGHFLETIPGESVFLRAKDSISILGIK